MTVLDVELERAAAGEFRGALLLGEGGVRKTRLAGELVARHGGEVTGLSARAYPLGETTASGVWVEALERYLRGIDPEEMERVCAGCLDDLASLLRSVGAVRGPGRGSAEEPPRSRVLEALTVLLSNLVADRPVVVLLDDVHLADASSLELLHRLAYGCSGDRMLVVATARPADLADRRETAAVLSRLEQDDLLRRLTLEPLGADALARRLTQKPCSSAISLGPPPPSRLTQFGVEVVGVAGSPVPRRHDPPARSVRPQRTSPALDLDLPEPAVLDLPYRLTRWRVCSAQVSRLPDDDVVDLVERLCRRRQFGEPQIVP